VESLEDIFTYRNPVRRIPATTGSVAKAAPNTAYKRQISQAIPSNERPNAPVEEQEDPEAQAQEDPPGRHGRIPTGGSHRKAQGPHKSTRARANPSTISSCVLCAIAQLAVQIDARIRPN